MCYLSMNALSVLIHTNESIEILIVIFEYLEINVHNMHALLQDYVFLDFKF